MDVRERERVAEAWSVGWLYCSQTLHVIKRLFPLSCFSDRSMNRQTSVLHSTFAALQLTRPLYSEKLTNRTICPPPPNSNTPPTHTHTHTHPPTHTITTYRRPRLSAFLSKLKSCRLRAKHNPQSPLSVSSK